MHTLTTAATFRAEAALLLASLRDRALWRMLAIVAVLLVLAAQAPLHYTIDAGREEGPGSDLPLLRGVFPPENDPRGAFRWTTERAMIGLPGIGQRPLLLTLTVLGVNDEVATRGARELELWATGRPVARLPVRPSGAIYHVVTPPPPDTSGDHMIELRSATVVPTGDERAVGTPLTLVTASSPAGPAIPSWRVIAGWLAVVAVIWVAVRRAGFDAGVAQAWIAPLALLALLGAVVDPPRFALGAVPALTALIAGWLLVVLLRGAPDALRFAGAWLVLAAAALWLSGQKGPAIELGRAVMNLRATLALTGVAWLLAGAIRPALAAAAARLGIAIPPGAWRWLALIALVVFATRYGGKIYPDSMHGDIGFHANRFGDVVRGRVLLVSRNRGVDFPYPPAFYLAIAPITLLDVDRQAALQLGAAVLDALSPLLIYTLAAAVQRRNDFAAIARHSASGGVIRARNQTQASALSCSPPLVAAAFYGLAPAGFLTTWWNFSTHMFTQFAHLVLIAAIVLAWPLLLERTAARVRRSLVLAILVPLQAPVYLGHFGFWMNMTILGGAGLMALALATLRNRDLRYALETYSLAFIIAQAIAILLFYSGYTGMFVEQLAATRAGGLTGLAGRERASFDILWWTLWDAGLRQHFGFVPLLLAPAGITLLATGATNHVGSYRTPLLVLTAGTIIIALGFAVLPFLSGSTLSTRWLMFAAWVVAVCAAMGVALLWRAGRAGKVAALGIGAYIAWLTANMWLSALLWRVRPPEPF